MCTATAREFAPPACHQEESLSVGMEALSLPIRGTEDRPPGTAATFRGFRASVDVVDEATAPAAH